MEMKFKKLLIFSDSQSGGMLNCYEKLSKKKKKKNFAEY